MVALILIAVICGAWLAPQGPRGDVAPAPLSRARCRILAGQGPVRSRHAPPDPVGCTCHRGDGRDGYALLTVALSLMPGMARITRSIALTVRKQGYGSAAIARGETSRHIVLREMLPNVVAPSLPG